MRLPLEPTPRFGERSSICATLAPLDKKRRIQALPCVLLKWSGRSDSNRSRMAGDPHVMNDMRKVSNVLHTKLRTRAASGGHAGARGARFWLAERSEAT